MFEFTFSNLTGFLFAFIPGLFSIGLVFYIIISLPRNRLVDVYAVLTLCGALWQMGDASARITTNVHVADLWDSIFSIGWIFIGALCLHFALLYSKLVSVNVLPWVVAALYVPAFLFLGLYQSHIYEHKFRFDAFWGWVNYHDQATIDITMICWISLMVVSACAILFYYAWRVRHDKLLFTQSIIIAIGISIPAFGGIISQMVFPVVLGLQSIPITSYFLTFLSVATLVALNRYRLFTISELINNELLLDELPVAVLSISDTGHITYMNKFGATLLGIERSKLRRSRFNKLMLYAMPEHEFNFEEAYTSALEGDSLHDVESSLIVKGNTINVMMSVSPMINNKKIRGVLFCIRDVSELKASLELREHSEASLKEAQKISHIGSWEWDQETNKTTWSDELYRIFCLTPGEDNISFDTLAAFSHADDIQRVKSLLDHAVEMHTGVDVTYRIIVAGGIVKYLHIKTQLVNGSINKHVKLFGTVQDITHQVESDNSLQQKNMELKRTNANLEEFVFVASHDLKEPVRKIITFGELVISTDVKTLSEKATGYFQRMIGAARRMQIMIDDLLSLSIISQNNAFHNCSLQSVLQEALEDLSLKLKEMDAVLEVEELPSVNINPKQFRQLFLNLISNSLKFAKKDVRPVITITTCMLTSREAEEMSLFNSNNYLKIIFHDNGIGFENLYSDKIFQMFQRLHGKVDYEGTGIGLAVCKKIVENHKGIISAAGLPGEGATFTIVIPVIQKVSPVTAESMFQ